MTIKDVPEQERSNSLRSGPRYRDGSSRCETCPEVGRNQSVGSCLCTDRSVDQKLCFPSPPRCRVADGRWVVWWSGGRVVRWSVSWAWTCLPFEVPAQAAPTTSNAQRNPSRHVVIDPRRFRNPTHRITRVVIFVPTFLWHCPWRDPLYPPPWSPPELNYSNYGVPHIISWLASSFTDT